MKKTNYLRLWLRNFRDIAVGELQGLVRDGGVMLIFTLGALGYPLLYSYIYSHGILEDTSIAVVDASDCPQSRRYIREMDATRELDVRYKCVSMQEAERLMQRRKVNGIVYFPADFGDRIALGETATLSIYADMSSFLYYQNLLMGTNFVMLDELKRIQVERYAAAGYGGQEISQLVEPIRYEENNPYNRAFSYTIFFLSAALLLIVQQTMFYGMSLRAGTMREENRSFARLKDSLQGVGVGRIVLGRGAAYGLLYLGIAIYIATIVPALFGLPQRGSFWDILVLLLIYVMDCVLFSETWSSLITRRETVFVLLLFISPVAIFLTGFSWPVTAFPKFWRLFSCLFPSTFACRAFINLNTAGGDLSTVEPLLRALVIQSAVYYFLASAAVYIENRVIKLFFLRKNA